MTIRPIDIRRHDVSTKRRFDEMTFRENDVAPSACYDPLPNIISDDEVALAARSTVELRRDAKMFFNI